MGIGYTEPDGTVHKKSFRIREQEQLTCADLDDYFSPRSRFHRMQFRTMKEQDVLQRIGHLMLVRESFVYEVDFTGWLEYMRGEGYLELPDKTILVSASEVLPPLEDVEGEMIEREIDVSWPATTQLTAQEFVSKAAD